jgi:membrane fusion protein, multidrug efflux system
MAGARQRVMTRPWLPPLRAPLHDFSGRTSPREGCLDVDKSFNSGTSKMRYVVAIAGLIALLAVLIGTKGAQIATLISAGKEMQKAGPPPEAVSAARAEKQTWEGTLSAVASVASVKGVSLSSDASGTVSKINFESGAVVKQGQVLVELDTSVERAQLASIRARREHAQIDVKRTRALAAAGVVSTAQLDADEAESKSLNADARALEAQIQRKTVRAPFSGRLGIRAVNIGQYLAPGTPVTVLESPESVYVDFTLPQQDLNSISAGMPVRARLDANDARAVEGTIAAIEPAIDQATRAVKVRVSVPNKDDSLRPGMFIRVEVILPTRPEVVAVPATAVVHASYGDSVFIVESKRDGGKEVMGPGGKPLKIARQQFVKLGGTRGDFVAILKGVTPGQEVVTAGAFKLRNGMPVTVNNNVKFKPELAPKPENR